MGIAEFSGRHPVGVCDVEWAAGGLEKVDKDSLDPSQHAVGRLFYPCTPGSGKRGVPWIDSMHQSTGYMAFLFFLTRKWWTPLVKAVLRLALWLIGATSKLPAYKEAAVEADGAPHPVVIFSHGLGGCRGTYAVLCSELASQGYVVLALEHTDGTASSVHLAGSGGWQYYSGMGKDEAKFDKVRLRQRELKAARCLLQGLTWGSLDGQACRLSGSLDAASFLRGRLDMDRLALAGHSFGGATVGAAAAKDPAIRAAVALDPWWLGMPPDEAALKAWRTRTPLLVIGSHAWNKPYDEAGSLVCGRQQQEAVLAAAKARRGGDGSGAVLLAIADSTHDTFSDLPILFVSRFSWLLKKLGFDTKLDPAVGMAAVAASMAVFLHRHLPVAEAPCLPDLRCPHGPGAAGNGAAAAAAAAGQNGGGSGGMAAGGLTGSDSGWDLVSADEAAPNARQNGGGTGAAVSHRNGSAPQAGCAAENGTLDGRASAAEGPSEATRADAANTSRVGFGGSSGSGGGALDPAAGQEASMKGGAAAKGGAFLPSAAELGSLGSGGGGGANVRAAADAAGFSEGYEERDPAAEAAKLPLGEATRAALGELLGDLAVINELHA